MLTTFDVNSTGDLAVTTFADLQHQLDGIPPERIILHPPPGTATEEDLYALMDRKLGVFELVDGVLVRKPMGYYEALIAVKVLRVLGDFVEKFNLGAVGTTDGMLTILPPQIRYPDVSFIQKGRISLRQMKQEKAPRIAPDLAIEVLSEGNTSAEMASKRQEYFAGGVRFVWIIDPPTQSALAYTSSDEFTKIPPRGILDGGEVLPGFELKLGEVFDAVAAAVGDDAASDDSADSND